MRQVGRLIEIIKVLKLKKVSEITDQNLITLKGLIDSVNKELVHDPFIAVSAVRTANNGILKDAQDIINAVEEYKKIKVVKKVKNKKTINEDAIEKMDEKTVKTNEEEIQKKVLKKTKNKTKTKK